MITLHYADNALLERLGVEPPRKSYRAVVAEKDGKLVGLAGVYPQQARAVMFAEFAPDILADKRALIRGMRMMHSICKNLRTPVHALADRNIPGAVTLLEHAGFRHLIGDVYQWPN